ncbi:lysosomal amino acid transporter 1 homolog [Polypterus senegalus]|uniref:lysosomal amino acid transporter 1 homolog n=1 Tax=Polypterus senegalus TaxID=55291 RepID=UPI0019628939|nr:lysosomal amino acid transporter 1 homolog [Polypterus senegalus]
MVASPFVPPKSMSNTHFLGRQHPHSQVYNLTPVDELLCMNGTPWIFYVLEECVETVWEYYSIIIGLISMACFLLAILPQLYESYRNGRADEALSQGFLLCLLGGDLNNFAGCYLTNQLPIQLVTAISYVCMDIIMISQFLYYKLQNQKSQKSSVLQWICFFWVASCIMVAVLLSELLLKLQITNNLNTQMHSIDLMKIFGYVCGYISSMFYLGSRFPQLYKNFKRKSTEGTSYYLFALAMMGNGTYGLSLVVKLPGLKEPTHLFITKHLAWLIGSFGVLFLDFFMTAQFVLYRNHKNTGPNLVALEKVPEVQPLLCDEDTV